MEPETPDLFADGISVAAGPYGLTLSFHLSEPGKTPNGEVGRLVGRVRLSPSLAFELAAILSQAQEAASGDTPGVDETRGDKTA